MLDPMADAAGVGVRMTGSLVMVIVFIFTMLMARCAALKHRHLVQHAILLRKTAAYRAGPDEKQKCCDDAMHGRELHRLSDPCQCMVVDHREGAIFYQAPFSHSETLFSTR